MIYLLWACIILWLAIAAIAVLEAISSHRSSHRSQDVRAENDRELKRALDRIDAMQARARDARQDVTP